MDTYNELLIPETKEKLPMGSRMLSIWDNTLYLAFGLMVFLAFSVGLIVYFQDYVRAFMSSEYPKLIGLLIPFGLWGLLFVKACWRDAELGTGTALLTICMIGGIGVLGFAGWYFFSEAPRWAIGLALMNMYGFLLYNSKSR